MKCTQRDPDARYQSCAELMYDLEHFDEMDNTYRRKMKFRLGIFITSVILTIGFGCVAIWGNASAENVKSKNYSYILSNAKSLDDYYNAILTDPSKTDAYIELVNYLRTDTLTKEEADGLNQLQAGLDRKNSNGYSETVNVLEELKEKNYDGYIDVCYEFGNAFLFHQIQQMIEKDMLMPQNGFQRQRINMKWLLSFVILRLAFNLLTKIISLQWYRKVKNFKNIRTYGISLLSLNLR